MQESNRTFKVIIIILSILLIGSSAFLFVSLEEIKQKDASIAAMSDELTSQKQKNSQLESNISNLKGNLSRTEVLLKNETQTRQKLQADLINLSDELTSQKQKNSQLESNISNLKGNLSRTEVLLKNETQTRQKLQADLINLT